MQSKKPPPSPGQSPVKRPIQGVVPHAQLQEYDAYFRNCSEETGPSLIQPQLKPAPLFHNRGMPTPDLLIGVTPPMHGPDGNELEPAAQAG